MILDYSVSKDDREKFKGFVDWWSRETGHISTSNQIVSHSAYQGIINMGGAAVVLMLQELQHELDMGYPIKHFFHALQVLTHAQPVPIVKAGNIKEMARA